jgi:hypothetical protein
VPHPAGGDPHAKVEGVALMLRGAIVPDPDDRRVPVAPFVDFDQPQVIYVWRAPQ